MFDVIRLTVLLLWPLSGWATSVTLGSTLADVPALAWVMVLILSAISGLNALLLRWREQDPEQPTLFAASHMFGSLLSGALAFLICEHINLGDFGEGGVILVASFAGARLIDAAAARLISRVEKL